MFIGIALYQNVFCIIRLSMEGIFTFSLFLYLLSVLLALSSFRPESKYALPMSGVSYAGGVALVLVLYVWKLSQRHSFVPGSFFEGVLFSILVLAVFLAAARLRIRIPLAPAVFSLIALFLGILGVMRLDSDAAVSQSDTILGGHVFCMFFALSLFTLSFIFSGLFLIQDALLKSKRGLRFTAFLPPLELTSRLNLISVTVGVSALFVGLLGGAVKASEALKLSFILSDPSMILSFLLLGLYFAMVAIRKGPQDRAKTLSYMSITYYILLIFIYISIHR